ncbi:MAG: B12-binding domain-containing radical SAM protein [Acidobacteria bacterium]|nr:B12-binding domain-containing radical SAM protein [Acidobacteriota bacterium]
MSQPEAQSKALPRTTITGLRDSPPKNIQYGRAASKMAVADAFSAFANPDIQSEKIITLIAPPVFFSKNSYSTPLTLPIGLTYLAAALEKAHYKVKVVDCRGADADNIRLTPDGRFKVQGLDAQRSIKAIDPETDIIGVSIMFSQEWPQVRDYINQVREAFPDAVMIVGGEHPTAMPEYTLRDCAAIDYVVRGEGELTLLDLVHRIRSGKRAEEVSGVSYLANDVFIEAPLSARMADITEMPRPAWHLIEVEPYFQPNFTMGISHGRNMAMLATRGCPYQCTFCSSPSMWTTRYVMRPVEDVVDEIEDYVNKFKANSVDFYDLTAIVKRDWILKFTAELERRNLNITWQLPSGTRSESLDEEVIAGLAKTGCEFLVYAPESGSKRTLEMIKKRVDLKNLEKSIRISVKYGIVTKVNFIIGFPSETRKEIFETLLFVLKLAMLKVDDCNISTFSPYPGSELFRELQEEGAIGKIDDEYFALLMTQFDFTVAKTFCRHVSSWEIVLYRIVGMSLFYGLSYLRSPGKIFRLVKSIFQTKFQPRSLFEQRIYDFAVRKRRADA